MPLLARPQRSATADTVGMPFSSFRSDSNNLDMVRALAVLSVFFAHLHDIVTRTRTELGWHFAQMGVLIFFVHTSMVLMLSLERTKLQGTALFRAFYLRRLFRLYPLAICCVTAAMAFSLSPDGTPIRHWTWAEYLSNLTLTTNLTYTDNMVGGLWTLPLEVQMYLALPFLFLLGRSQLRSMLFPLWLASVPVAILQPHISGRLEVLGYAPCFLAGVIAWKLSLSVLRRLPGWLWPVGFVATWPVFLVGTRQDQMYYRWAFCLVLSLAIPWFQEVRFRPLELVAHVIAKHSYGIYLSHIGVMLWCFALPVSTGWRWAIFVPLAVISPVLIYHSVEHPLMRLGQRLATYIFSTAQAGARGTKKVPMSTFRNVDALLAGAPITADAE